VSDASSVPWATAETQINEYGPRPIQQPWSGYYRAPYASSVTTRIVGAPPELIDAAWVNASLPLEAAVAFSVSIVGKLTSEIR